MCEGFILRDVDLACLFLVDGYGLVYGIEPQSGDGVIFSRR